MSKMNSSVLTISQYSHRSFLFCTFITTFASLFIFVWLVRSVHTLGATSPEWLIGLVATLLRVTGTVFMWDIWRIKSSSNTTFERRRLDIMENAYHILIGFSMSLRALTEVVVGHCSDGTPYTEACNLFYDTHSVDPTYMVSLMVIPFAALIFIRDTRFESIAASWTVSVSTLVFCAVYMNSTVLVYPICIYICSSLLMFYDTKRQNDDMLRLLTALQTTVQENERLQEQSRATEIRAMIGNVAHDLKTPLTAIFSGIECIQEVVLSIEKEAGLEGSMTRTQGHVLTIRSCLKSLIGSNTFMTMCINRCLDYTKASKGVKLVPKPETVSLQEALDFPISIMRDVQTLLPIKLAPLPAEVWSHIITDKQWLMENVLCLLSNAVRYSQAGSVEVRVLYRPGADRIPDNNDCSFICIEVWDTGIGLPESVMTGLFAPFKQAQRLAGGTGLGLFSLAKRVEALRGEYGVCKRPDGAQGSMFWFSIPYRPDKLSAAAAAAETAESAVGLAVTIDSELSQHTSTSPGSRRSYRVLVADDAPSILKMTTMLLTKKGHSVEKAVNGAQAVDMVLSQQQCYDVVLMDLQMPVMDGPEAIRRIRAAERKEGEDGINGAGDIESGGEIRKQQDQRPGRQLIIALSANSDSDTMQEALDAGADHFMSKPFAYESFRELMRKHNV